jgi:hypothetical protein
MQITHDRQTVDVGSVVVVGGKMTISFESMCDVDQQHFSPPPTRACNTLCVL